jgi:hypothetical protein
MQCNAAYASTSTASDANLLLSLKRHQAHCFRQRFHRGTAQQQVTRVIIGVHEDGQNSPCDEVTFWVGNWRRWHLRRLLAEVRAAKTRRRWKLDGWAKDF